jgi:hypothetical protein
MLFVVQSKQPASLWPASQTSHIKGEDPQGHENWGVLPKRGRQSSAADAGASQGREN